MRDSTVASLGAGSEDFDIAPELEKQEYRELARLLEENNDLFAVDLNKPGCTSMCEHNIDTGDATPIKERASIKFTLEDMNTKYGQ